MVEVRNGRWGWDIKRDVPFFFWSLFCLMSAVSLIFFFSTHQEVSIGEWFSLKTLSQRDSCLIPRPASCPPANMFYLLVVPSSFMYCCFLATWKRRLGWERNLTLVLKQGFGISWLAKVHRVVIQRVRASLVLSRCQGKAWIAVFLACFTFCLVKFGCEIAERGHVPAFQFWTVYITPWSEDFLSDGKKEECELHVCKWTLAFLKKSYLLNSVFHSFEAKLDWRGLCVRWIGRMVLSDSC